jgi:outer membrane protein OmpA-like peptidoglycan-associated protein
VYGNRGTYAGVIPIDILVIKEGDRYRISISSIYFKPNTADYVNIDAELARKNMETLDQLAQILKKYGDYKIQLEGHAVRIFWSDPAKWRGEEQNILMPLSTERAEVIRDALIQRGIRASRMSTEGFGGTRPLVPHSDLDNRWKNRRVEFILLR